MTGYCGMGMFDCFLVVSISTLGGCLVCTHLLGVGGVVQAQTPHRPHVLGGQGRQEGADVDDLVGHVVLAKDVALDDAGLARLADVGDAAGQDGVAVVGPAVPGQEADEALGQVSVRFLLFEYGKTY